ncbi:hypothetical protein V1291_005353 [Nitrobacteraceae bacterium AZCC 1564]
MDLRVSSRIQSPLRSALHDEADFGFGTFAIVMRAYKIPTMGLDDWDLSL